MLEERHSSNTIDNLTCRGYCTKTEDWGLQVEGSQGLAVRDSSTGPVKIDRNCQNTTLRNVDVGDLIQIHPAARDTRLINCKGTNLISTPSTEIKMQNCQFHETSSYESD